MLNNNLKKIFLTILVIFLFGSLTLFPTSAKAQIDCTSISYWSNTNPKINQMHVFCGEWDKKIPKGFHSIPKGQKPSTVESFSISQSSNQEGIYGIEWSYAGHPNQNKFSTIFPDSCTQKQIINSIIYAHNHPSPCPTNTPTWAVCGLNQPPIDTTILNSDEYCKATNGGTFSIAQGLKNGDINTAFPIRE